MKTTLYLIRHGATVSNLTNRLQGRGQDPPLAPLGERQAKLTRDFLAIQHIDACYASPLQRASQTASIIAEPHDVSVQSVNELTECDVGDWEGLTWEEIERQYPDEYAQYMSDPAQNGYLRGETFADVHKRAGKAIEKIFANHQGQTIVIVAHHVVNRVYLVGLLGLPPKKGRIVSLDNCGISVIVRKNTTTHVKTLNSVFHLRGVAA